MADIVIFGAGRIAETAKVYIDHHGPHRVVGFTVDGEYLTEATFHNLPVVAWERLEEHFSPDHIELLGPLSYRRLNEFRRERHLEGKARGYRFASFVHPAAHVYAESIGENSFILEANVIQPFVRIGAGVMLWSGNHIGHHSVIDDYCFLASNVVIGSAVHLGERCFVGGCSGIDPNLVVGPGCFIGGFSLVSRNLAAESVVPTFSRRVAPYTAARIKRLF